MIASILLLTLLFPPDCLGIRRDMVYEACKRDPSLAFCDSHILGKAPTERASTPQPTLLQSQDPFKEMRQWLEGFKDETDDDETENEKSRHLHEDKDQYCHKYYQNYRHYCFDDKETELEGVLNQFCDSFRVSCEGIIPGVTRPAPGISRNQPATDGQNGKGGVKPDKTEEYCKQFKPQYGSLCSSPTKQSAEFCQSYKDNCLKSSSDAKTVWPSSSTSAPDEGFLEESLPDTSSETEGAGSETSSRVAEYCEKYSENYNYYCVGDTSGDNDKFCNSFRKACPEKVHSFKESGSFLGERSNGRESGGIYTFRGTRKEYCEQFSVNYNYYCKGDSDDPKITQKFCPSYKQSCLQVSTTAKPHNPFEETAPSPFPDVEHPTETKKKGTRAPKRNLRPKRACTEDCDQKIYPHCTRECKCDYAYPYVQKFCNPPPLPLFLNTCRLWYNGCPKYEQYHYASQFVYSKAEKGKKIEGPVGTQAFSVVSPTGERLPVNLRQPGVGNQKRRDEPWEFGNSTNSNKPARLHQFPGIKNLPPGLKAIIPNVRVSDAKRGKKAAKARDDVVKDEKAKLDNVPVVPPDSVFQTAVSQYNAYTDNQGILHRPRSRSPFTKPGLWEPNPDDPHNRDHANKWYYAPKSVNADWLNGQVAWGAHWAVPAAGVGGTDGFSALYFPTIGTFANIPDDYD